MKQADNSTSEEKDRISELPTEVKHHIVSFLCIKDAIATTILSPLWRYTWLSLSSFHLGSHLFHQFRTYFDTLPAHHPEKQRLFHRFLDDDDTDDDQWYTDNDSDSDSDEYIHESIYNFESIGYVQLLEGILQVYINKRPNQEPPVIKKLKFYLPTLSSDPRIRAFASDVAYQWLSLAKNHVQELSYKTDVEFDCANIWQNCNDILKFKSLTKLKLKGCKLTNEKDVDVEVAIDLPCLRKLSLVSVNVDCKLLDFLLGKCGELEKLKLSSIEGVKVLRIQGLCKLKKVKVMLIDDLDLVEINATALQSLTLIQHKMNQCKVQVASSSSSRNNLVELYIDGCGISDDFFDDVAEFPQLDSVTLLSCAKLKRIKITSNCLRRFCIEKCPNVDQVDLNTPKMIHFRYSSTRNSNIMSLLSKYPIFHASLRLKYHRKSSIDHMIWRSKLVSFLSNFSKSKYVDLATNSRQNMIIPQQFREKLYTPLCEVQDLRLTEASSLTSHTILQYLDNLLWLCPRPRTISLLGKDLQSYLSLELQYEDILKEGETCSFYPAQPVNCWSRVLKDFRIVCRTGVGDHASIRKLLDDGLKKWKGTASD